MNFMGQVTAETLGNAVQTARTIDAVTGLTSKITSGPGGGASLQNDSYYYDLVGNLTQRQSNKPAQGSGLSENFHYDDLHRLHTSELNNVTNLTVNYDAMGNITSRSDVASGAAWTYDSVKKHAVKVAGDANHTYNYDANGNANTRNGYGISWTSYDYPYLINGPNKTLTFSYGPDRQRFRQVYTVGTTSETTTYIGGMLETVTQGSVTDWRHYISAGGRTVAVVSRQNTGTNTTSYLLQDHQGSVSEILNSSGSVSESFTAFGARRDALSWSGACPCADLAKMASVTRHGYTGHEAIGGVSMGLNHMNGRVQDAITGRFLSPDPYVTEPGNTQGFNRYSYVNNNPLSFTDPSGFVLSNVDRDPDFSEIDSAGERRARDYFPNLDWVRMGARQARQNSVLREHGGDPIPGQAKPGTTVVTLTTPVNESSFLSRGMAKGPDSTVGSSFNWASLLAQPDVQPTREFGPTRDHVETATGAGNLVFDVGRFHLGDEQGVWRGQNGKYYSESWGGNGATGARRIALADRALFSGLARFFGYLSVGQSAVDVGVDIYTDSDQLGEHTVDLGVGTYSLFGGGPGALVGGIYFIGKATGLNEAIPPLTSNCVCKW